MCWHTIAFTSSWCIPGSASWTPTRSNPLQILQSCRIRWGTVDAVDDEHAVLRSRPLIFDDGTLALGSEAPETVRWARAGTSLTSRPAPGQTVSAHWDWVCGALDDSERDALAAATASTLELVNRLRAAL